MKSELIKSILSAILYFVIFWCFLSVQAKCEAEIHFSFPFPIEPCVALLLGGISSVATFGMVVMLYWFILLCWNKYRSGKAAVLMCFVVFLLINAVALTHDYLVLSRFFVSTGDDRSAVFSFLKLMFQ